MILTKKDVRIPAVVSAIEEFYGKNKRPDIRLKPCPSGELEIPPNWHDYNYRKIQLIQLVGGGVLVAEVKGSYDSCLNSESSWKAYKGGKVDMKSNMAILVLNTYPPSVDLYIHEDNVKVLALSSPSEDLTEDEKTILKVHFGYISSAREEEVAIRGLRKQYSELKLSLYQKGYLTKSGAVTMKAKNTNID